MLVDFIQDIHKSTKRDYKGRMNDHKVECAEIARRFDKNFFDGSRRFGYGGLNDDGRYKSVAKKIIERYKLNEDSQVLDIGCAKGFLGKEIERLSGASVWGCDISEYALENCSLQNRFKFVAGRDSLFDLNQNWDLIISINTLHNLRLPNLKQAITEINRRSKNAYIVVESYRNVQELHNLECWALTCEQFFRPEEWEWLLKEWGYSGDIEYIFFE